MNKTDSKLAFYRNRSDPRHGTTNGYTNLGCRCDDCRSATTKYHADYMKRNPDQVEKQRQRSLEGTALRRGYPSRAEYENNRPTRRVYSIKCPFCDWEIVVPRSWVERERPGIQAPGFMVHVRAAHPPKMVLL